MRRSFRHRPESRRGVAAVEMALVLPIFLAITLGIMEYGRAMMAANLVTNAAREGARAASIEGSSNAAVQDEVVNFLTAALGISSNQVSVTIAITPAPGNPNPQNECANAKLRDLISVEARVPYTAVAIIPASYLSGVTLTGRSYMRHE